MYDRTEVVSWMLENIPDMTNKKLQKLLYYTYAWYLVFFNETADSLNNRLFDDCFEAWVHGPVIPSLYRIFKDYHSSVIPPDFYQGSVHSDFDPETLDLFNQIKDIYGKYNGNELESISHQEEPWRKARTGCSFYDICNNVISDVDIFNYYIQRLDN